MGIVDVVSEFCSMPRTRRHLKKRKQFQTVEMKVSIDCEDCERKVKEALEDMKGVSSVEVTAKQNKVTVAGCVDAAKVMRRVAYKTGKRVEPWPYVPGAYDKKAPAGYVRNVVADPSAAPLARGSSTKVRKVKAYHNLSFIKAVTALVCFLLMITPSAALPRKLVPNGGQQRGETLQKSAVNVDGRPSDGYGDHACPRAMFPNCS